MKQLTWHHTWLGIALLFMFFWFPPIGLVALYFALQSGLQMSSGALVASRRSTVRIRELLRTGIFAGLVLFLMLCAYVFVNGGEVLPAIGSMY